MVSAVYWAPAGSDPLDSSLRKSVNGITFNFPVLGSEPEKKKRGAVTFNNLFREGYDDYYIRLDGNVAKVQASSYHNGVRQNVTYDVLGSDLKKEEEVASLEEVRQALLPQYADGGYTGQIRFTYSNKKEDKMALTFWDSLKLVSPEVGEQFETEQEYRDAVLSAGAFLHASDSLDKLGAVYGSGEVFVCDFDGFDGQADYSAEDAYGPDSELYKKNTEENN